MGPHGKPLSSKIFNHSLEVFLTSSSLRIFTNSFLRPNKDKANMAKRMKNARDFKEG